MINSPFGSQITDTLQIPNDCEVVVVADLFKEDYVGGAELTTEALIESSPLKVYKLRSKDVNLQLLEQGHSKYWIFGNFSGLNLDLIPTIVSNMNYSILEYDYKFCRYRSPEKHESLTNAPCDCREDMHGKMVSAFMYGAKSLWWMSERQQKRYTDMFPFLEERENWVLSSVFDNAFFITLKLLKEKYKDQEKKGWLVLGSESWIKGTDAAIQWCVENEKEFDVIVNWPYEKVLEELAQAEGFVYLPLGGDTCPRMVIEAKLLGCDLNFNDNVEHRHETWFDTKDSFDTEAYLFAARDKFWNSIVHTMNYCPDLSGYTTTLNCNLHEYPWRDSISSLLSFCDEVIVVDGGSEDGTWEELQKWAEDQIDGRLKVFQVARDWTHPRFAVFDGAQKAAARNKCIGDFCWQQDADEVVHEDDYEKIKNLIKTFPKEADLISLPVIEYWGGPEKVRMDINPWKWRLSRNKPHITHGIPKQLRKVDENGNLCALPGTDGCDYIHKETAEVIPHATFYTKEIHELKNQAFGKYLHLKDETGVKEYEDWFNRVIEVLPGVHHFSWFNLPRKIKTYKNYWSQHWQSLYNINQQDTAENNMFFDKPWQEVEESEIIELATKLSTDMGGWVFHSKIDWSQQTPSIKVSRNLPQIMLDKK
ncbi:MAG: hypothetical protein CMB80_05080 [Flammeovirgaceae bacterium]|nr:hypothetical protein [Flammeovirgaceae bacterium]|tara:strand:- start:3693 stop:5636 length:1944 start_codon:yes stop_codon:yes gene_type:complete